MGLFVPTSKLTVDDQVFTNVGLTKGQIYNLDNQEFLCFQFNPSSFEWEKNINWSRINWFNSVNGGELQYINQGPKLFDLSLIYVSEPGAPELRYNTPDVVVPGYSEDRIVSFEAIVAVIDRWTAPIEGIGRPARLAVIIGPNRFEGVIMKYNFRITEFFHNLTAREGRLVIEFEEWIPVL